MNKFSKMKVRWRAYYHCLFVLQLLHWHGVECVILHERDVREEQHQIYVARTSNNRVIMACELYCCLLPQCETLCTYRSGFSDRNRERESLLAQTLHNFMQK